MSATRVACPHCGRETAADRDFCEHCGEYLVWAPTGMLPAIGADGEPLAPPEPDPFAGLEEEEPDEALADEPDAGEQPTADEAAFAQQETTTLPAVSGPQASGAASLGVEPADPGAVGRDGVPSVEAGRTVAFLVGIRNESRIVDNFELSVHGLDGWALVSPGSVFLTPLSSAGESVAQVRVDITPPRLHTSTAGIWTIEVRATSQATGLVAGRAFAQFDVQPFTAWTTEATPLIRSRRLKARYRVTVRNDGNAYADLWMVATPEEDRLRTRFKNGQLGLAPGEVGVDELTLRPPYPLPTGRRIEHRATVDALPTPLPVEEPSGAPSVADRVKGSGAGLTVTKDGVKLKKPKLPKVPKLKAPKLALDAGTLSKMRRDRSAVTEAPLSGQPVVFRQKPIIPIWALVLLVLLAGAGYLVYTLLPERTTVPALVNLNDTFTAERALRDAGLKLAQPIQTRDVVNPDIKKGTVVDQLPPAGKKVDKGDSVVIVVATGSTDVLVPRLTGLTRVEADRRLRDTNLSLGQAQPADAAANFVVKSQVPAPTESVATGTPVQIFLTKPPEKKKKGDDKKKGAGAGGSGGGGGAGGGGKNAKKSVVIPAVGGKSGDAYVAALNKLKLEPVAQRRISGLAPGRILQVTPAPGQKARQGDEVTVRISSGSPNIAVETQSLVQIINPLTSRPVAQLPDGDGSAVEPTFSPDGEFVLYRSDTDLKLARTAKGSKPRTLLTAKDTLVLPSFSDNDRTVAVLRRLEDDGDLCFGSTAGRSLDERCLPDDGWDLFGRPAWRPDGRVVLVPARNQDDPTRFGLRAYTTRKPFSTNPEDWSGRTTTDTTTPGKGVIAVAYSRDGSRLGAVTNLNSSEYQAVTTDAVDVELIEPTSTSVPACDLAWRPDGDELTVVQADAGCSKALGTVVRFPLDKPTRRTQVAASGQHPTYVPRG